MLLPAWVAPLRLGCAIKRGVEGLEISSGGLRVWLELRIIGQRLEGLERLWPSPKPGLGPC